MKGHEQSNICRSRGHQCVADFACSHMLLSRQNIAFQNKGDRAVMRPQYVELVVPALTERFLIHFLLPKTAKKYLE